MTIHTATIEKNKIEELRVTLKGYKGYHYIDARTFTEPYANEDPARVPTKKGITLAVTKLPELMSALKQAEGEARAAGLLLNQDKAA